MDGNHEEDLSMLKVLIQYYFFSDAVIHPKEKAVNKEKIIYFLKDVGFPKIYEALLKDIMAGKYDKKILRSYELEHSHYRSFLKKPITLEELKGLVIRYFLAKNSSNYSEDDLKDLYDVICLLLIRFGYTMEVDEKFLKDFQNGVYDNLNPNEVLRKQRLENLERAYQNRDEDWETFCEAFYEEFSSYVDIYSLHKEEMIDLAQKRLGKDEKNVLR